MDCQAALIGHPENQGGIEERDMKAPSTLRNEILKLQEMVVDKDKSLVPAGRAHANDALYVLFWILSELDIPPSIWYRDNFRKLDTPKSKA